MKKFRASTMHVPATIGGTIAANSTALIVIQNPSLDAGSSASANIEASDRDRTVNVGNHMGRATIQIGFRGITGTGFVEVAIMRVERSHATPALGTSPVPTNADITSVGLQQASRLDNPGRVYYYMMRELTSEVSRAIKFNFSPAKYRKSKVRSGDYWIMLMHNRSGSQITYDYQGRFKEYQ